MTVTETARTGHASTMAATTAAREAGLKRGEFEIAVHLGIVRLSELSAGERPRVRREEIERIRSADGFPDSLKQRVRTVGTAEGARMLRISPVRFTRLARAGCLTPIAFYLNRYRAVVWLYLATEVAAFAVHTPRLLVGNSPPWMRAALDAGTDCRARNWRSRRVERLLTLAQDPWARCAVLASVLDPVQLAATVPDPYERAHLIGALPEPVFGMPVSISAREAMARMMRADEPDELVWHRTNLLTELATAREGRPAPRPGSGGADASPPAGPPGPAMAGDPCEEHTARPGQRLLSRIGRRGRTGARHVLTRGERAPARSR